MGEISVASAEQSQGIGEVSSALGDMDGMTQQNMALVEEASAAAQELQGQAAGLAGLVGQFKLDADRGRVAAQPAIKTSKANARPSLRLARA